MTDNEILLALSNMLEPIRGDIQDIRGDIQDIRGDIQDIKGRIKKIEIVQENDILPQLREIQACYISTYDRYKNSVEEHEAMKQDISILKSVVMEHSEKLQKIS